METESFRPEEHEAPQESLKIVRFYIYDYETNKYEDVKVSKEFHVDDEVYVSMYGKQWKGRITKFIKGRMPASMRGYAHPQEGVIEVDVEGYGISYFSGNNTELIDPIDKDLDTNSEKNKV